MGGNEDGNSKGETDFDSSESADQRGVSALSALNLRRDSPKKVYSSSPVVSWAFVKRHKNLLFVLLGLTTMFAISFAPLDIKKEQEPAQRCAGLLAMVSLFWATECLPSHITALLVPLLVVLMDVMRVPTVYSEALVPATHCPHLNKNDTHYGKAGELLTAPEAASVASAAFFDPVILLFMSGFTMAAALEKYGISRRIAVELLKKAGRRPSRVLLALMVLGVVLSMWVSNVAAAVLNVAVISPLLRRLDSSSKWPVSALLGIAYSCNIGGMSTPIASPQNVIAIVALKKIAPDVEFSFLDWCYFAWPFCAVVVLIAWGWLRYNFKTNLPGGIPPAAVKLLQDSGGDGQSEGDMDTKDGSFRQSVDPALKSGVSITESIQRQRDSSHRAITRSNSVGGAAERQAATFGAVEVLICSVVVVTIGLWIAFDKVKPVFGNLGIIGLLPCLLFYGTGILNQSEFNSMPWSVLMLMGGGLCLGNAVQSSGLLDSISDALTRTLDGQGLWVQFFVFNLVSAVIANFISSTVAAIIMLPVFAQVGLSQGHPRMFVVSTAIMCSGAMGLPVSSFPNANSMAARSASGVPFLTNGDFVKTGFAMALFSLTVMSSLGYAYFILLKW
eukprot:CAMPEP_0175143722 /NCGR_PEP_ID=MMETSP0087-20121206/13644_1 /TAXON_ID=136419 /ORGANISM="Unknown Unknown, Strain D1" /LENGTH=615 /DNA_ID=CAMNT_0016427931 /DNA_START=40 /DNA_END=1887 /DNA_ORIENTATION=-